MANVFSKDPSALSNKKFMPLKVIDVTVKRPIQAWDDRGKRRKKLERLAFPDYKKIDMIW